MSVKVGIIMGSDSDLPVMSKAAEILDELQVPYELTIVSAHRTPDRLCEYAKTAEEKGLSVIIAGAGGAAHLPGMTAAMTVLPVIGVPVQTKALGGVGIYGCGSCGKASYKWVLRCFVMYVRTGGMAGLILPVMLCTYVRSIYPCFLPL